MSEPDTMTNDGFVVELPCLVKASPDSSGRRMIEVEASNEIVDQEGDVITQIALLDAAPAFLRSGILDQDHISEIGGRLGIPSPSDWIVGVPSEVKDIGKGRTAVIGELHQPIPGVITKADEIWNGLIKDPPVRWRASIYGFPKGNDGFVDVRVQKCPEYPAARRYVVKAMTWKSLALTRNPINDAITGSARIVTMKSYVDALRLLDPSFGGAVKGYDLGYMGASQPFAMSGVAAAMLAPRSRLEAMAHFSHHMEKGKCPHVGMDAPLGKSVASFRQHFANCCGLSEGEADLMALALMQALKHERTL